MTIAVVKGILMIPILLDKNAVAIGKNNTADMIDKIICTFRTSNALRNTDPA